MEPHEHPAQPADGKPAEGLENWLQDLRTDVAADPFAWADTAEETPPSPTVPDQIHSGGGGRHRAAD
ncbi:hypothetical protein [Actinoplanes awajinensis]|uniref:Uncharacterized protein n=1 Tax=Actinoplanes awajinensis subsp. mycoplanecinus TaxID=135947 RepID=A0A0X3VAX7_9ACTN|nr:hypothetical protein [Actinoplanes awajinensis]KUL41941.1 hypothetical protein ADL15_02745 [Actinoplanes awajinensis subsp. mycoplanecinus]